MRISDWSSDVCSSDLSGLYAGLVGYIHPDEKTANRLCMGLAHFFVEIEDRDRRASVRKHLRGCASKTRGSARDNHTYAVHLHILLSPCSINFDCHRRRLSTPNAEAGDAAF